MSDELTRLPATALARLLRERKLGAVELVEAHLAVIEKRNPAVNAFCTVAAEEARAAARQAQAVLEGEAPCGRLTGIPIGIKDTTVTAGIRTTWGSPLFRDHVPAADAEVVRRVKAAGAVILGKTNTPEFAAGANTVNPVFGATRNPWNTALSAAGSTGGGAAALAACMTPLAEGTDFGGSLRTPAAFCGVVGLRTTAGLVPKHPVALPWHDVSVAGPMARTAEDCALLLDVLAGYSALSPLSAAPPWESAEALVSQSQDLKGMRIAYVRDIAGIGVEEEIDAACRSAALALGDAGAAVEETSFDVSDGRDAFVVLRGQSMVGSHWERVERLAELGENLAGNIRYGLALKSLAIGQAERKRAEIWHRYRAFFERYDLLLTPTAPVGPFPVEENYPRAIAGRPMETYIDWIAPTFLVSLAALPAASVPAGLTADRLPVGLQIVGPRFAEPRILSAAKFVQRARPIGFAIEGK